MTNFEKWRQEVTVKDYVTAMEAHKHRYGGCRACPVVSMCRNDVHGDEITCTERLMMFALMEVENEN